MHASLLKFALSTNKKVTIWLNVGSGAIILVGNYPRVHAAESLFPVHQMLDDW